MTLKIWHHSFWKKKDQCNLDCLDIFRPFLAALAALCIPTLVTDCYDPFLIKSLPDLGEVIGMVGEIRASGEGDKHMRRKGNT